MKKYKKMAVTEKFCVEIKCDICKKVFDIKDYLEIQEFHFIDFYGGYGSVFGDATHIKLDICQECLKSMLEKQGVNLNELPMDE